MSTTVGASSGLDMLGNYLFTPLFEYARNGRPRVTALDQPASGVSKLTPALRVAKQGDDGAGEVGRVVGADVMAARTDAEPLGADGRRHHRPTHRQCFKNLQPRPAAGPEGDDIDRGFRNGRPDIVHGPGDR